MDKELLADWDTALASLLEMPAKKRKHFALLLINLAKCYTDHDNWKAVILINNEDALLTFSAGADEFEAAQMIQMANEAVTMAATADAPDKEMYN
jgi:hypothetical protein